MSISAVGGTSPMRSFQPPSFSTIDSDASGGISLDEMKTAAPGSAADARSAERAERLFSAMDADGDGSVTSDEKDTFDSQIAEQRQVMQFMTQLLAGGQPPSNDDVFAATDADGSKTVSFEEFSASDSAAGLGDDALQALYSIIDADGDGAVTEAESSDFLDDLKSSLAEGGPGGPPPGGGPGGPNGPDGPPPGGRPPQGDENDEEEDSDSLALDLLAAAQNAYSGANRSEDLLSTLSRVFESAA